MNTLNYLELPRIPERTYNILTYKAKGDGAFLNTHAIQTAIDEAHGQNGAEFSSPKAYF